MKVLIAMSGGVDSSVAALIVKRQGYDCIGCTMKLYDNEEIGVSRKHTCCTLDDVEDARSVSRHLSIPYYVFNFKDGFRETVIDKFVRSYENGLTPNPCIDCNRYMKFDKLYDRARVLGCEKIVTGHYAQIEKENGKYVLKKAADKEKDQSYVLYSMTQEQLEHTLFPLGKMKKSETRQMAEENGLVNSDKPDSEDICFVPDGNYAKTIERLTGRHYPAGDYVLSDGTVIGRHKGIICYTIGQRKGLGISAGKPLYVCEISPEKNTVTLGDEAQLFSDTFICKNFNWISGASPTKDIRCNVKIRYRQKEQPATVAPLSDGSVKIVFDSPQRAVTPGQSAVLYDGDTVLGGGEIFYVQKN